MKVECREFSFRETRMGGLTRTILISLKDFEVISPTRTKRTRSLTHGTDIYCLESWNDIIALTFMRSNRGNTYLYCSSNISEELCNELREIYKATDSVEETIEYLKRR